MFLIFWVSLTVYSYKGQSRFYHPPFPNFHSCCFYNSSLHDDYLSLTISYAPLNDACASLTHGTVISYSITISQIRYHDWPKHMLLPCIIITSRSLLWTCLGTSCTYHSSCAKNVFDLAYDCYRISCMFYWWGF